ncbi:olfactory receptor 51G2-like [Eublepharis macularius]|uniref:Olfactory receptor n=1 Tax=Eublepharis macularius TaxID=481883 RepID=A0AA97J3S6_EUBMA|nr:olfactory receptor 51G2-like [Eublepharis macularius]
MLTLNGTRGRPASFLLTGFSGLGVSSLPWLSIPICSLYIVAFFGNCLILVVIKWQPSLHEPMYLFLSMLSLTDLGLSISTLPTVLQLYALDSREISVNACLAQLFFIHTFSIMESSVLLAMAFDRFVAIRHPLRYVSMLTRARIRNIGLAVVLRGVGLHVPAPILLKRLPYCKSHQLSHSYCLHPDVMKLACADTTPNSSYGLFVLLSTLGLDSMLIVLSYILILRTVLSIASREERLKALSTCVSHICAVLLFYTPLISLSMIHRFWKRAPHHSRILLSYLHFLVPPVLNPVVYSIKTQQVRKQIIRLFHLKNWTGSRMESFRMPREK